jgi:hypothetical protein
MDLPARVRRKARIRLRDLAWGLLDRTQPETGLHDLRLDYPIDPEPRWGWSEEPHPQLSNLFARSLHGYRDLLALVRSYGEPLRAIPHRRVPGSSEPFWDNGWFTGLDAAMLYTLLADRNPATYVEIGSGNSTRFARRAINDHGLRTKVISVDPAPRSEVNDLCDSLWRTPLESVPIEQLVSELTSGDLVLFDGSHRSFQNSDVTVFFLEFLPRVPAGVVVGIDDIHLPNDYPAHWANRVYNEAYLLAVALLAGDGLEVLLPGHFVCSDERIQPDVRETWSTLMPGLPWPSEYATAIWLVTTGAYGREQAPA